MKMNKIIFYIIFMLTASNNETYITSNNKQIKKKNLSDINENMNAIKESLYNIIIYDYFIDNDIFYLISNSIPDNDIGEEMLLDLWINKSNGFNKYVTEEIKALAKKDYNCDLNLQQYSFIFDNVNINEINSIKIQNITILKKEENSKININIKKDKYFFLSNVCANELINNKTYYRLEVLDYFFNFSEIYLNVSSNIELKHNFTLTITINIYYRIIDYNFESKTTSQIINVTAKIIKSGLTYEFYCNFEDKFNINQTYDNYFIAYIMDIIADKNQDNITYDINFISYEIYVGDYNNSYKPRKYNNDLGINNYKGLSIGKIIGITFGELGSLLIIGIIVFIYTKKKLDSQKYKCNDSEKPENKNKSNNTELRINLPK